jgi:hypothetical protein
MSIHAAEGHGRGDIVELIRKRLEICVGVNIELRCKLAFCSADADRAGRNSIRIAAWICSAGADFSERVRVARNSLIDRAKRVTKKVDPEFDRTGRRFHE